MSKKALVFQDLIPKMSELYGVLQSHAEVTIVTGGRDALDKVRKLSPTVVILCQDMAQLSGLDLARQIAVLETKPTTILVHDTWSPEQQNQGQELGCQLQTVSPTLQQDIARIILPGLEVSMESFDNLVAMRAESSTREHRDNERQIARGSAQLKNAERVLVAEVHNIAKSGVLLIAKELVPVNSLWQVTLHSPSGESVTRQVTVVRSEPLESASFGVAAQFVDPDAELLSVVENWLETMMQLKKHCAKVGPGESSDNVFRGAQRVAINKPVHLAVVDHPNIGDQMSVLFGKVAHQGYLLNISRSGVLVGLKTVFPNESVLQLVFNIEAKQVQLNATVVRTVKLKTPIDDYIYGMGAKFINLSDVDVGRLEGWVQKNLSEHDDIPIPDSRFVESVLKTSWENLKSLLVVQPVDERLRYGQFQTDLERKAITQDQVYAACVRELVMAKVKLGLFHDFVPALKDLPDERIRFYVQLAHQAMKAGEAAELQIDGLVKTAVEAGDEGLRNGLNTISNQFFEVKNQAVFKLADAFIDSDLKNDTEALAELIAFAEQQKSFQDYRQEQIKYDKKKRKPLPPKEAKAMPKVMPKVMRKGILVLMCLTALIGIAYGLNHFIFGRMSIGELTLSVPVQKIVKTDFGLDVYVKGDDWLPLVPSHRNDNLDKLEALLIERKIRQAKVLNEQGRLMAATAVVEYRVGEPPVFGRRIYNKPR